MPTFTHIARPLLLACALVAASAAHAAARIEHWTQPGGAQVWFVSSPALPMLDVRLDFDAGSRRDPAAQAGLASATALMTGKGVRAAGGQPALDENQLGEAWADLGARFGASAGSDRMSFRLRTLTDPALLPRAVALAARELAEPAFTPAVWQRERARLSAAIEESLTRPGTVAARAFGQAVHGGHPYGQDATPQTLARITAADLRAFHQRTIAPCRAKVSVVGAVSRAEADAIASQLLARLPRAGGNACPPLPAVAEVPPLARAASQHIPFRSAQAHVLIGQPGHTRRDPDFFALLVGNHILGGGGFTARLMHEVREKRGLSYGAYSQFSPGLHAGAFTISLQTRPDQARQAVQVARDVLDGFVQNGPTADELQAAKDNLTGGFALRLDSNAKLLGNVANIAWHGLPLDYLDHWTQRVNQVSAQDIRRAFQRVLQPERMVTVTVGAPGQATPPAPPLAPATATTPAAPATRPPTH